MIAQYRLHIGLAAAFRHHPREEVFFIESYEVFNIFYITQVCSPVTALRMRSVE